MELNDRISIISDIIRKQPKIGKTAVMKYIYLLQKVYKLPMGYDYSIYTYGPYSSTVMEDIDYAENMNIIDVKREIYPNGFSGYCITLSENATAYIETAPEYTEAIKEMLSLFKDKSAKELELLTTIVYIYSNYVINNWDVKEVPKNVHDIKPHFDLKTIESEFDQLNSKGILAQAVA